MKQIYSGNDLRVTLQENESSDILFVTFNSWHPDMHPVHPREIKSFGKDVLYSMGYNQINVESNKNNSFQTDEIFPVADMINTFSRKKCKKVFTYGSSMGGFGSINFASHLHADYFIAISPLYSIHPARMPEGDTRWRFEFEMINYRYDFIAEGLSKGIPGLVFYDEHSLDKPHAESIAAKTKAFLVNVPYSGHPSGVIMNRLYGLKRMLKEVANETFHPSIFSRTIHRQIKSSPEYLMHDPKIKVNRDLLKYKITSTKPLVEELIYILQKAMSEQDHEIVELTLKSSRSETYKNTEKYAAFIEQRLLGFLMLGKHEEALFEALKLGAKRGYFVKKILDSCDAIPLRTHIERLAEQAA